MTASEGLALGLLDAVAAEAGGARAEAGDFLAGVLKHDAYSEFATCFTCMYLLLCILRSTSIVIDWCVLVAHWTFITVYGV